MKYICPYCKFKMPYVAEKQYCPLTGKPTIDYLLHRCIKSNCKIGTMPKYKVWEYQEQVQGISLIFDDLLATYKIVSRYDQNVTRLSKMKVELGFNYSTNILLKRIIEINSGIKIDLEDPIGSSIQASNRLKKLLVFS